MSLNAVWRLTFLCLTGSQISAQNLLINGSFEQPLVNNPQFYIPYSLGATFSGWRVTEGSVDVVSAAFPYLPLTSQVLDLNGTGPGAIEQTIATIKDGFYQLTWTSRINPASAQPPVLEHRAEVLWNGQRVLEWSRIKLTFTDEVTPIEPHSVIVVATGRDTVTFRSLAAFNAGYLLDNVSLISVPEPTISAVFLLGLIMIFARHPRKS
jgi:hypothetical protein